MEKEVETRRTIKVTITLDVPVAKRGLPPGLWIVSLANMLAIARFFVTAELSSQDGTSSTAKNTRGQVGTLEVLGILLSHFTYAWCCWIRAKHIFPQPTPN